LVAIAVVGMVFVFVGGLRAQGRSGAAFERVKEVQERQRKLMAKRRRRHGGRADRGNQAAVLVLLEEAGVAAIPTEFDGVPVRPLVTGKSSVGVR
jgi:hypothetical protein